MVGAWVANLVATFVSPAGFGPETIATLGRQQLRFAAAVWRAPLVTIDAIF
jgi:hypothetical protein